MRFEANLKPVTKAIQDLVDSLTPKQQQRFDAMRGYYKDRLRKISKSAKMEAKIGEIIEPVQQPRSMERSLGLIQPSVMTGKSKQSAILCVCPTEPLELVAYRLQPEQKQKQRCSGLMADDRPSCPSLKLMRLACAILNRPNKLRRYCVNKSEQKLMKLLTKRCRYQASNCYLDVSPCMKNVTAVSYNWWEFVTTDSAGNVIFNDTSYSPSTGQHQRKVRDLLHRLGFKVTIYLENTRVAIDGDIIYAIKAEIDGIRNQIESRQAAIAKKGSHRKTNERRAKEIEYYEYRIQDLQSNLDEYCDKKPMKPLKYNALWDYCCQQTERQVYRACRNDLAETFSHLFQKPNGKVSRNELNEFVRGISYNHQCPANLDKLSVLFNLRNTLADRLRVLTYYFIVDLQNMIPDVDTTEYSQLVRWLKSNDIHKGNLNPFQLDRVHAYLINKTNRRTYEPKPPVEFPVRESIRSLETVPELRLLDTDRKLKAEGRSQSHCIGSASYIAACKSGYMALNYKGYTFFLSPTGEIDQTHGRYNSQTPAKVRNELTELIRSAS